MRRGVNAGFGEPLGVPLLQEMLARGIVAIRQALSPPPAHDHRPGETPLVNPPAIRRLIAEVQEAGMPTVWLATLESQPYAPDGSDVELLNEPDLHGWSPSQYAQLAYRALAIGRERGQRVWIGSVSNLGRRQQDWLHEVLVRVPQAAYVSAHRYPTRRMRARDAQEGFDSRAEEMAHFRRVIGERQWMVTECGFHGAVYKPFRWLPWVKRQLTDAEIGHELALDLDVYARGGAQLACVYQLNDGRTPAPIDQYGLRTFVGEWKPAIMRQVFRG